MRSILLFWLIGFSAMAQSDDIKGTILGKGKPYPDKISLRWNISNYQLFQQLVINGVHIDRMTLDKNSKVVGNGWTRITDQPIKALSLEQLKTSEYAKDTATAIVAQGLYGKTKYPDNMGLIDQIKNQDMDRQNRHLTVSLYSSMNQKAATAAGLGFDDKLKPEPSYGYVYRLIPHAASIITGKIDTGFVYVSGHDVNYVPHHTGLKTRAGEGYIVVSWPKENGPYTGYYIERSANSKNFKSLTESIYLPNTDPDSTQDGEHYYYYDSVANYVPYYYRVTGLNAFGERVMFADTVKGMAEDFTAPEAPLFQMVKDNKKVTFKWGKPNATDLKGYFLMKGRTVTSDDGLAAPEMIPPSTLSYEIKLPDNFSSSYYRLMLTDTSGNVSFSHPVYVFEPDLIPPAPPTNLKGHIDTLGIVHVKWNLDTSEEALRGYKIYMANQDDHQYIPISEIVVDTVFSFQTTLQTLSKDLYIKVVAIDGNFNHSDYSKTLTLRRPDKVPPIPPQILDYKNTEKGIELFWSTAASNDLMNNILYKRLAGEDIWKEVFKSVSQHTFLDKEVKASTAYEYSLRAIDSSGLYSEYAHPVYIRTSNAVINNALVLKGTHTQGMAKLAWTLEKSPVQYFILYKDQGEGLTLYKTIQKTESGFEESNPSPPQGIYAIKIKYEDNTESDLIICK